MASPINQLPRECKQLIRGYASDKLPATPTALLISKLDFQYHETNPTGIYLPRRLEVRTMPPVRFSDDYRNRFISTYMRRYYLHDFLPSYWNDFADTYDGAAYDDPDLLQRLQIPPDHTGPT